MKIASLLKASIAITVISIFSLIAISGYMIDNVYEKVNQANVKSIPSISKISLANEYFLRLRISIQRHIMRDTVALKDKEEALITSKIKKVDGYMKDIESIIFDAEDQAFYDQELATYTAYFPLVKKVMAMSRKMVVRNESGNVAKKSDVMAALKRADKVGMQVTREFDKHIAYNQELASGWASEGQSYKDSAVTISMIFGVLVLLVLSGIGIFILRSLMRQLGQEPSDLLIISNQIAEGNLSGKINIVEKDTNSVAYSFKTLQNTITNLVQSLNHVSKEHDAGNIDETVDANQFKGAYAEMASGLNAMVAGHIDMSTKALACVKSFGEGDLQAELEQFPGKKAFVNEAIEQVRTNINALVTDTNELSKAAIAGNLSTRADVSRHQGDFRKIVQGINDTLDAVITPLNVAASYVESIANGDVPNQITETYHGDFNTLKNNLNQCIAAINNLITDANQLAESAAEGQLSTRADASQHQGDFRKIIEGVNSTLDSVIGPLNIAADTVDRISKGDIPSKINETYNGDFNAIKNNLNTCIDAINHLVSDANMLAEAASEGRVTVRADVSQHQGDFRKVVEGVNATLETIVKPIAAVKEAAELINTAAGEISSGNNDLSSRTENQAANLEETASSMEELASTVKQNAENAKQANQLAIAATSIAEKGGEAVGQVVNTMSNINDSATKIENIISVIDGIAFQTNILALNAAVEAARAGEQGRGFAVVAGEVRSLAQRSASAAKEIKELIGDSVNKTSEGTAQVENAGKTMEEVVSSVKRVSDIIGEIAAASIEQSTGINQVNMAITNMDETTQQNAALVEEAAAAAESLLEQANKMTETVSVFKLDVEAAVVSKPKDRRAKNSPLRAAVNNKSNTESDLSSATKTTTKTGTDSEWEEF